MALGLVVAALAVAGTGFADARSEVAAKIATAARLGTTVVPGRGGWYYFAPELRHLNAGRFWAGSGAGSDAMPAILDFKAQCAKAGVELILAPVPGKAAIYPENLLGHGASLDSSDAAFLSTLRGAGVKVIDLASAFRARKSGTPLFCKQDTHWSGTGIALAADMIASQIKGRSWYGGMKKSRYSSSAMTVRSTGDLGGMASPKAGAESIKVMKVSGNVTPSRTSPVVLLGDSHNLIFSAGGDMIATGAGLPENLAMRLGFPVDLVAVRGSGATPARMNLARRRDNLQGKKVVVWCFTTREFTEGQGWRKVPVVR